MNEGGKDRVDGVALGVKTRNSKGVKRGVRGMTVRGAQTRSLEVGKVGSPIEIREETRDEGDLKLDEKVGKRSNGLAEGLQVWS